MEWRPCPVHGCLFVFTCFEIRVPIRAGTHDWRRNLPILVIGSQTPCHETTRLMRLQATVFRSPLRCALGQRLNHHDQPV